MCAAICTNKAARGVLDQLVNIWKMLFVMNIYFDTVNFSICEEKITNLIYVYVRD